jgi:GntR family transcriptional repressor for pyruvate dehydrogenase complex
VSPTKPPVRSSPADDALRKLIALIEDGALAIGTFLPAERQLAERWSLSRVVVREAARKLEQRGLVSIRHGIGVEVTNNPALPVQHTLERLLPSDKERLRQCAQARLLIEPELAATAAVRATPKGLRELKANCVALASETDLARSAALDIAFHDAIADLAGNKVLAVMLRSVAQLGRLSREVTLKRFGVARAHGYHVRILAALTAADPAAARKAMKLHLEAALGDLS